MLRLPASSPLSAPPVQRRSSEPGFASVPRSVSRDLHEAIGRSPSLDSDDYDLEDLLRSFQKDEPSSSFDSPRCADSVHSSLNASRPTSGGSASFRTSSTPGTWCESPFRAMTAQTAAGFSTVMSGDWTQVLIRSEAPHLSEESAGADDDVLDLLLSSLEDSFEPEEAPLFEQPVVLDDLPLSPRMALTALVKDSAYPQCAAGAW